jgi:transcriptional regulator with XRE-family HTH domain
MKYMFSIKESDDALVALAMRLRHARLGRDETMQLFAQRIGISVPTLRAMERGSSSVQIGHWVRALWALDRLSDLATVLTQPASPLDRARQQEVPQRQRASRRPA